MEVPFGKVSHQ